MFFCYNLRLAGHINLRLVCHFNLIFFVVPSNDKRKLPGNNQNLERDPLAGKSLLVTTLIFIPPYLLLYKGIEAVQSYIGGSKRYKYLEFSGHPFLWRCKGVFRISMMEFFDKISKRLLDVTFFHKKARSQMWLGS